jgi:O-succinylbenzoate synthase
VIPERLEVYRYKLALLEHVRVGHDTRTSHPGLLVCVVDEHGRRGWGDIAPLMGYSSETLPEAEDVLKATWPRLLGLRLPDDGTCIQAVQLALAAAPASVRFGFETALAGIAAQAQDVPLYRLWQGTAPSTLPIAGLLQGPLESVVPEALRLKETGFVAVKLKVGAATPAEDAARVREVSLALGPSVELRLDANRAWSLADAVRFGELVQGVPLAFIEEPVAQPLDIPEFHGKSGLNVALDETLGEGPFEDWIQLAGIAAVVIKPTVLGGIVAAGRVAEAARRTGLRIIVSSAYESGVGLMALGHIAAALGTEGTAAGLGTYRWIDGDVVSPKPPLDQPMWRLDRLSMQQFRVDRGMMLDV